MTRSAIVTVNALAALKPTAIGIAALPSPILQNQVFTVQGNLYDTTTFPYVNVSGKTLHVSYSGVVVGDVATGAAGYSLQMSIPTAGTYRVRVDFDGDADYLACYHETPEFTVTAAKKGTLISINVSPASSTVPFTATVTGSLTDTTGWQLIGKSINLYINGTLTATGTTANGGAYGFNVNITVAGTYQFQTEFPGDADYEGCSVHNGTAGLQETKQSLLVPLLAGGFLLVGVVYLLKG